jgi:hypothetical protein
MGCILRVCAMLCLIYSVLLLPTTQFYSLGIESTIFGDCLPGNTLGSKLVVPLTQIPRRKFICGTRSPSIGHIDFPPTYTYQATTMVSVA